MKSLPGQNRKDKGHNLRKQEIDTMAMIRQAFRYESMCLAFMFEWKSPNSLGPKGARQVKSKVKRMFIILLTSRMCSQRIVLACQTINLACYCGVLLCAHGNVKKLCTELCCIMTTHHLVLSFSPENF
jgi:hypothetical protein